MVLTMRAKLGLFCISAFLSTSISSANWDWEPKFDSDKMCNKDSEDSQRSPCCYKNYKCFWAGEQSFSSADKPYQIEVFNPDTKTKISDALVTPDLWVLKKYWSPKDLSDLSGEPEGQVYRSWKIKLTSPNASGEQGCFLPVKDLNNVVEFKVSNTEDEQIIAHAGVKVEGKPGLNGYLLRKAPVSLEFTADYTQKENQVVLNGVKCTRSDIQHDEWIEGAKIIHFTSLHNSRKTPILALAQTYDGALWVLHRGPMVDRVSLTTASGGGVVNFLVNEAISGSSDAYALIGYGMGHVIISADAFTTPVSPYVQIAPGFIGKEEGFPRLETKAKQLFGSAAKNFRPPKHFK